MSTEPASRETEPPLAQACEWLAILHSGEFTFAQQQQLAAWRAADAAHERAWQQAQALWQGLEGLRGKAVPGMQPLLPERYRKPFRHRRLSALAVACSLVLAVTLAICFPPVLWQADYVTEKGEQRTLHLADGSTVILNTATALSIHFDDNLRRIELLQGEAFFEVAKGKQAFLVATDSGEVRAVGTAFSVRIDAQETQVELVEGKVDIQDVRHQHRARLNAGQTAQITASQVFVQHAQAQTNLAVWRDGYLQFDGLPLADAIAQINRYRPGKVMLLNSRLAQQRVSGLFRLDALDQAIAGLKAAVPQLQAVSVTPYWVVLR